MVGTPAGAERGPHLESAEVAALAQHTHEHHGGDRFAEEAEDIEAAAYVAGTNYQPLSWRTGISRFRISQFISAATAQSIS